MLKITFMFSKKKHLEKPEMDRSRYGMNYVAARYNFFRLLLDNKGCQFSTTLKDNDLKKRKNRR